MIHTRLATPSDDLATLWPNVIGKLKLNLEQVIVLHNDDGAILAGALLIDGGHDVCFVAEARNIAPKPIHYLVTKRLHNAIWKYLWEHGKTMALFHCAPGEYAAMLQRKGATVAAVNMLLMKLDVTKDHWR